MALILTCSLHMTVNLHVHDVSFDEPPWDLTFCIICLLEVHPTCMHVLIFMYTHRHPTQQETMALVLRMAMWPPTPLRLW